MPDATPNPSEENPETNESPASETGPEPSSGGAAKPRRFRWKIGLGIFLLGALIYLVLRQSTDGDRTQQIFYAYIVFPSTALLLGVWWVFFSGLLWKTKARCLIALALLPALFRNDGFQGDFVPEIRFRWSGSIEDDSAEFYDANPTGARANDGTLSHLSLAPIVQPGDWPEFRGALRDGILRDVTLRTDWDANPPELLWKHRIGLGWSSFSIVGEFAFTQEQRLDEELVVCYDASSGEQLWAHADEVRLVSSLGGDGPRATPTFYESRLYALGATGILNCLDPVTGSVIWSRNILEDADVGVRQFGMSGSPLVYDDVVVVNAGGAKNIANSQLNRDKGVIAYDRLTGDIVWAHGSRPAGYAAPRLETIGGVRQVLIYGSDAIAGHDAATGEELWWYPWKNHSDNNCAQPILLDDETLFVSSGYGLGSVLLSIEPTGDGRNSKPTGWKTTKRFKLKFNGGVLKDGYIYGLNEGILTCLDVATGKHTWKKGRYKFGQILLVGDVILVLSEDGEVALVETNPKKFREITRIKAIEGKTWNHPVIHNGRLYVRNSEEAACFDLR